MTKFKVGTRVRVTNSEMSRAWDMVNEVGTVTGRDPKGFNKDVVAVKLDSKSAICEAGINISYLEVIPKVK